MHPVLVHLGSYSLRSYAVLTALGGGLSFMFLKTREKEMGLVGVADFWVLVNTLMVSGFVGARLLSIVLDGRSVWTSLRSGFFSVNGGFSVFGLLGGVLAGTYFYSRVHKLEFERLLDYVAFLFPLWLVFGRFGCFLNGCCYGCPSRPDLAWAVSFSSQDSATPRDLLGVPLHPTQLYEAAGGAALAGCLYVLLRLVEKGRYARGLIFPWCLAGYGALRFVLEWLRGDSVRLWATHFTIGQALSFALILLAGAFFLARRRRSEGV